MRSEETRSSSSSAGSEKVVAELRVESVCETTVGAVESDVVVSEESDVVKAVVVSVGSVMVIIGVVIVFDL